MYKVCPECGKRYNDVEFDTCRDDGSPLFKIRSTSDPLVGTTLVGRFTIIGRLGKGGFGTVYRAVQHPVDREVAVKVLKSEHADDELQVKRFFVEARSISQLRSPNTIRLFDFGQTEEGALFIAMELSEGLPLSKVLKRGGGRLPPARAARIMAQVCDSLQEAHSRGIYHRDLKPDNVMVEAREHRKDFVKVLDFGVAKINDGNSTITQAGTIQGTPAYMSPEAAKGEVVSHHSDLYSVGVMLFELLTGLQFFRRETAIASVLAHIQDEPPAITEHVPDLPPRYAELVMSLLAKDPADRPQSASEVRLALVACADIAEAVPAADGPPGNPAAGGPTPLHTRPMTVDQPTPAAHPPAPRHIGWAIAGIVALGIVLGTVIALSVKDEPTPLAGTDGAHQPTVAGQPTGTSQPTGPQTTEPATAQGAAAPAPMSEPAAIEQPRVARLVRPPAPSTRVLRSRLVDSWDDVEAWTVSVEVNGTAGAQITLNGNVVGRVPSAVFVPYGHEPVTLTVSKDGHKSHNEQLVPNADLSVKAHLKKRDAPRPLLPMEE